MRKTMRRIFALILSVILALSCGALAFAAGEDAGGDSVTTVQFEVTYQQSEARGMLELINDFRTGDDAWYWNENSTEKIYVTNLSELTYDYTLERIAMQRAAEIALSFSHTRPDEGSCFTAYDDYTIVYTSMGENIAAGGSGIMNAAYTFELWQETDDDYSGQGHRRNMLSGNFTSVGIACVEYNGYRYWVQAFGWTASGDTSYTEPNDGETTVSVDVAVSSVASVSLTQDVTELELEVGKTVDAPGVEANIRLTNFFGVSSAKVAAYPSWSVGDTDIAEISGGTLTAKSVGSTTLTASVLGVTATVSVNVTPISLAGAVVTLEQYSWPYTGKAITPEVTVTLDGVTLIKNTDYTVSYQNNIEEGTATVVVTGTGSYTGTASTTFTITPCDHVWNGGEVTKEASCSEEGIKTYTCTLCGSTRTEAIAKLEHTLVTDPAVEPTCTSTGLTDGSHCSVCGEILVAQEVIGMLPHSYEENIITPATCTQDGETKYVCSACGDSYTETVPATEHEFGDWETIESPGCTAEGSERRTCSKCGYTETRNTDAEGHSWEDYYTVDQEPTCTEDGSRSIHCANCDAITDSQVIPAAGHSWDEGDMLTEPTCTETGAIQYSCAVCGETRTENVPATGHTGVETERAEATCTEDGYIAYKCEVCGETYTESLDAAGHVEREPVDEDYVAPTCTEDGSYDSVVYCTICNDELSRESVTISAFGHAYVWQSSENDHWQSCENCGDLTETAAHELVWVVDQEASAAEDGAQHQECAICGYVGAAEVIPATGGEAEDTGGDTSVSDATAVTGTAASSDASAPSTGDGSSAVPYAAALIGSAGLLAVLIVCGRRRKA